MLASPLRKSARRSVLPRPWLLGAACAGGLGTFLLSAARGDDPLPPGIHGANIIATARVLSQNQDESPSSRFAPLPATAGYPEFLLDRLRDLVVPMGGSADLQFFAPQYEVPDGARTMYANAVARIPGALGSESPGYFLVGAHLDATASNTADWDGFAHPAPGADDNASGVAAILEVLRHMGETGLRPQADLVVAFFDGEERHDLGPGTPALLGSIHMAEHLVDRRLFGFVNLDMVGYNPRVDSLVVITNVTSRWLTESLIRVQPDAAPGLILDPLYVALTFSDHAPFWTEGYDAVLVSESGNVSQHNPTYHRVTDTVDNIYYAPGREPGALAEASGRLLYGMLEAWSRPESVPAALEAADTDILFGKGRAVDAALVSQGDTVQVTVGVTNRGGTRRGPWSVTVDLEHEHGMFLRTLGTLDGDDLFPAGAHRKFVYTWIPADGDAGTVFVRARVNAGSDAAGRHEAVRSVAVEGSSSSLLRAYAYPNPTDLPEDAHLHYELSRQGAVRLKLLDMRGQVLASADLRYDPVVPGPGVDVGEAEVRLGAVFPDIGSLAPGLYLIRVELFTEDASASAAVEVVKLAILR